jgi:hypothetical protein
MKRSTLILVGTFVVLLVITYFLVHSPGEKSYEILEKLPAIDSSAVDKIELKSPDKQIVLEKMGSQWMLTSPIHYPASQSEVEQLIRQLKSLKLESLISENPEKQSLYKVDSTGTAVTVFENKRPKQSFILGKEGGDYLSVYLRKANSKEVYLATGLFSYTVNKAVREWRDKTIYKTVQQSISQVVFRYGDTTLTLQQQNNVWLVDNDTTEQGQVEPFLSAISNLQGDDFVDTSLTQLPSPRLVMDISSANNGQIRLYPRGKDTSKYIVQVTGYDQLYELTQYSAERLMKHKNDFTRAKK